MNSVGINKRLETIANGCLEKQWITALLDENKKKKCSLKRIRNATKGYIEVHLKNHKQTLEETKDAHVRKRLQQTIKDTETTLQKLNDGESFEIFGVKIPKISE